MLVVLHKIPRWEFILKQFFFFLLLILLFFPLSLHSKSSTLYHFSSSSFLLYNETVIGYFPNGSHYILYEFYFQNITLVFENGTMEVETIVYDINSTSYLPPAYSLDYVSHPTVFMFVNPSDLGKPEVRDGLVYNGTCLLYTSPSPRDS